jgi:hypothetical protein
MSKENALYFQQTTETLLLDIGKCSDALESLLRKPDLAALVDESNALGGRVTVMEPMVLQVELKRLLNKIKDIELISEVQQHDPKRERTGDTGQNWYTMVKGQRPSVAAIKELRSAIRNQNGHAVFDVADAKRILELVEEGFI